MKIKIIAMCNVKGQPAMPDDVVETDEMTAGYLISIQKAEQITPVISTDAEENSSLEPTIIPDPSPKERRAEKKSHGHRKTATQAEDLR